MITVSLCMIVKNEEDVLSRCLSSVQGLVEEMVVVDTGSTDSTKEVARKFTDRVFDFPWAEDFSQARNFSLSQATQQFCLWMDADDVIDPEYRQGFLELKQVLPPQTDVVMLPYHAAFDEGGRPVLTYYRERLIRRLSGLSFRGAVHEAVAPVGNVVTWDGAAISHRKTRPGDPDRNLRIFEGLLSQEKELSPREQFYYARELAAHGRDEEAAWLFEEFLSTGRGWVENELQACRDLSGCLLRMGKPEEAFTALAAALRYGPPRAGSAATWASSFSTRGTIPPRPFGMRQPSPGHAPTKPAPLSLRTATGFCPASSCACVTTAWETSPWPGSITAGPETVSRTTRPFFTTSGSSGGSCNALAARREERSVLPGPPRGRGLFLCPEKKRFSGRGVLQSLPKCDKIVPVYDLISNSGRKAAI